MSGSVKSNPAGRLGVGTESLLNTTMISSSTAGYIRRWKHLLNHLAVTNRTCSSSSFWCLSVRQMVPTESDHTLLPVARRDFQCARGLAPSQSTTAPTSDDIAST